MHRSAGRARGVKEMPVDIVVSPSDGSFYNKGSSMIENKADWWVNHYLQSNQFASRRVEEEETSEEDGENHILTNSVYNASDVF